DMRVPMVLRAGRDSARSDGRRIVRRSQERRGLVTMRRAPDSGGWAGLAAFAVLTLAACGGIADEFLPNTENGRLEIHVARAVNTAPENVTEFATHERLRFARGALARTLPAGIEVLVEPYASDYGVYRFGGGWITKGDLHLGRHAVPTEPVDVVSSDARIMTAEIVPDPTNPGRHRVRLTTLEPGTVRLTFRV